ncbi:cysteine synthase family protein [Stackebrandtia nassauensis]|uniref:Pyridoxal-5'-phosphate-dependent protein beta subunit n=1 Tax=Stackebrandtia nassauensis (strain DSM 44728 / CIP 108903 / NRRL B-16338 / NBRC 102104 / LLR-40K-21) TaxID=446470 RepID=D3Q4T9_STANL|nr:cysteine synthase family protein [Stackebrandtia nassauensis]ADD42119.1 Pyridoxal-5'-phosphate-dependent protein beta subunit [Stackebrandtia nassauensis DSM 44728]
MKHFAFADIGEAQRLPRIVCLGPRTYGVVFSLMKLLPAWYILSSAAKRGELGTDTVIVETTSGTFGLGLAMQTALSGHQLILVGDPAIDKRLRDRLEGMGAQVEIVTEPAKHGGIQQARLDRVAEIRAQHPDSYCPDQYANPDNPLSYSYVAEVIAESVGQVDCLVGPIGSGGSMCGTTRHLRTAFGDMRAIAVDTHHSVIFGQADGHRGLRGLGNSLMPANVDHGVFDEVHWIGEADAYAASRRLLRGHALFTGPTSGAAFHVGRWWANANPDATTVIMCPDEGYRYQDTVYNPHWIAERGLDGPVSSEPDTVATPGDGVGAWSRFDWGRRQLAEVLAANGAR